jgi:protein-disulfide isomerase
MLIILTLVLASTFSGCKESDTSLKDRLGKILKENPELITESIAANPAKYMEALQGAARKAQMEMAKKREEQEKKNMQKLFDAPLEPLIRKDEAFRGTKGAPITLVEYSDFECPYCKRGFATVKEVMEKYKGKVQFVYKHLPLSFHKNAMIASKYYEAIRMQSEDKAFKFHDLIFESQSKLKNGEGFLKKLAKKVGANMGKLAKDVNSDAVKKRIEEDMKEAEKFEIRGTPGYLINGIPIKGAYPASKFVEIIEELKKRGKLTL